MPETFIPASSEREIAGDHQNSGRSQTVVSCVSLHQSAQLSQSVREDSQSLLSLVPAPPKG